MERLTISQKNQSKVSSQNNQFSLQPILIQQNIQNSMHQSTSMVGQDEYIQAYQDAEVRLREELERAKLSQVQLHKMLASDLLDTEVRKNLQLSMKTFNNFVDNKIKATILCTGSISSGKSSMLNALLGNCILPSGLEETTETITKLIPSQDLCPNTFILTRGNGQKETLNDMNLYRFLHDLNIQEKQNTQNPLLLEIETNFLVLNNFKENPLLIRQQLEFVDLPGCDSKAEGKDQRILEFNSKLGDSPKLILFIISPENISKKSTDYLFTTARGAFTDEINNHKLVQKEFQTILKGLKGKEIQNDNDDENTEKLVQQRLCIVISKYDLVRLREAKNIQEKFLTDYKIQPNFASSKKQIEFNTLQHRKTPHNISILLYDKEMEKQAIKLCLPKNRQVILDEEEPSSWTEGDIQNVLDNVDKLFKRQFEGEDDGTVEASTKIQQLAFQLMIKITNECTQYLKNNSRKIEFLSEIFSIGLDEKMIDQYIIPQDFELFRSARDQCYQDLKGEIETLYQQQLAQLNTQIQKVVKLFMDLETYVHSIWNLKSFNNQQLDSQLIDSFQKPMEDTINEFQQNMEKLTESIMKATINSMRSRMPFLNEEIHVKISLIFQADMFARQQVCQLSLCADDIQHFRQQIRSLTWMLISQISLIAGVMVVESIGAAFAFVGVGFILLLPALAVAKRTKNKIFETIQEFTQALESEKSNIIQSLRRNQEDSYKSNMYDLSKSLEKVLYALDNAYAYKNSLET